jgi:glycosyltransferase involved in cell wall biosynthesis
LRNEYRVPADRPTIGIVGRLCEVKNQGFLFRAIAHLARSGVKAAVFVIGDGHLRSALESLAEELGISDQIVFTGFRRDVLGLYDDLDVVALTSVNEGTPLTLIEAMSRERALASTLVGGVRDLMGERVRQEDGFEVWTHGVTSNSDDPVQFGRALRFLIEHPQVRREMGECGRRFVHARHSKARLLHDIEQLYLDLLDSSRRPLEPAFEDAADNRAMAPGDPGGLGP